MYRIFGGPGWKAWAVLLAVVVLYGAMSQPRAATTNVIEAERIILRDPKGTFRMELGEMVGGWGIRFIDTRYKYGNGEQMARLILTIGTGNGALLDFRGGPMDGKTHGALSLGVNDLGWAGVTVFDRETGYVAARLGETRTMTEDGPEKRGAASLVLKDAKGNCIWKAP